MHRYQKSQAKQNIRTAATAPKAALKMDITNHLKQAFIIGLSIGFLIVLIGSPSIAQNSENDASAQQNAQANDSAVDSLLGTTTVTESRRENGQRYRIELEHSVGGKQYIEENDSDGKLESTSNDIEDTPNLPKWKLGSW